MSIRELREAVEAGRWDHDAAAAWLWTKPGQVYGWAMEAFGGSLDAAKRLHDALLPDHRWTITPYWASADWKLSSIWAECRVEAKDDNPARAWLIAILRALEEEARDD